MSNDTDSDHRDPAVVDGPGHDPVVTLSEERLRVATEIVPVGRVRLRRHLVTEEQTFTVAVTREEVTVDHEELPAGEQVPDGGALSEDSYEMIRYEDRVLVTTQRVAVERVRLVRRVVTVDHTVTGQVRREVVGLVDVDDLAGVDRIATGDAAAPSRR